MTTTAVHALDLELLPNESLWGPGFGLAPYPAETLAEIARYLAETRQPGYGARLHSTSAGYVPGGDRAQVPPGYDAMGHPNRAGGSAESMD
ncbi:MAG: NUDIX hydrolase, partial [Pseudonocardiaceae bacterium]